jgi:uncharacterized protein (DUF1800 family)
MENALKEGSQNLEPPLSDHLQHDIHSPRQGPRRHSRKTMAGASAVMAAALSACGGGGGGSSSGGGGGGSAPAPAQPVAVTPPAPQISDAEAARFLLQTQFSASDADVAAVKTQGYDAWLNSQYATATSTTLWNWLDSRGYNAITTDKYYFKIDIAENGLWHQLIASPDQVRKRITLALSEHFVAPFNSTNLWPAYIAAGYWDMLNANAFSTFRALLEAVTLNLQMGIFLNVAGSRKADDNGRQPDENYAREVMQLFTIGLTMLNNNGTPKTDVFGNQSDTFKQDDVTNLSHVFTGYAADVAGMTTTTVAWESFAVREPAYARKPMIVVRGDHSPAGVSFLGTTIPANTPAEDALRTALDTLCNHPNVGPFFAAAMIKRLVTSNPSPAYIGRVAAAFNNNGAGVRGDLKAVWTAIFTDVEARALPDATTGGKLREPIVRFVQWARTADVATTTGNWAIADLSSMQSLGQSPLRSPSVFNFFRPGYIPPNTVMADKRMVAPEFQIVNETTTAGYLNFMLTAVQSGVNDVKPQYSSLLPKADDAAGLVAAINLRVTGNQLSSATTTLIQSAVAGLPATTDAQKLTRVQAAVYLTMASPEYLIQK